MQGWTQHGQDLAYARRRLQLCLLSMGNYDAAITEGYESIHLARQARGLFGRAVDELLDRALVTHASALMRAGLAHDSISFSTEAVLREQEYFANSDEERQTILPWALVLLSEALLDAGDLVEALESGRESIELLTGMSYHEEHSGNLLSRAYTAEARALTDLGRLDEALDVSLRAMEVCGRRFALDPQRYASDLAVCLNVQGIALAKLGRYHEALKRFAYAVELIESHAESEVNDLDAYRENFEWCFSLVNTPTHAT